MASRLERTSVLPIEGLRELQGAKKQIQDAAVGKIPDHLILAAVKAAMRCASEQKALSVGLTENVAALVRDTLLALGRGSEWKPDTVLKMTKSIGQLRCKPGNLSLRSGQDERNSQR